LLLILTLASGLAQTPYSFADGYALCKRHEHTGPITEEGWTTRGIVWDDGFRYCHDFMGWWAESGAARPLPTGVHPNRVQDKLMLDEMERALGPYSWPVHAK
jgi:hypothetical protein